MALVLLRGGARDGLQVCWCGSRGKCRWTAPTNCHLTPGTTRRSRAGRTPSTSSVGGEVNWVNAPFALIGKVIALVRGQGAVAAIVIPRARREWWQPLVQRHAEGVAARLELSKNDPRCQMVGKKPPPPAIGGLAVVFLDYRRVAGGDGFTGRVPAEKLMGAWLAKGRPAFARWFHRSDGRVSVADPNQPIHRPSHR